MSKEIAQALLNTLISPNESDRNMEPANVVDAICRLSREIHQGLSWIGDGDSENAGPLALHGIAIRESAFEIADAIRDLADAVRNT
jgi:hypothetical protein